MRMYIIANDGITLCREAPAAMTEGEIAVTSKEELHAAPLNAKRLLALWNALPGVEKRKKVGDRMALIDQLWTAIEALPEPEPQSDAKRPSKQDEVIAMLRRPERQRQLRQIAEQFNQTGEIRRRTRVELKSGTRLVREWQGRTYEVLVLDDGFSWQGTHYGSLSAVGRKITGTPWSGPLFFGLKQSRPAAGRSSQLPYPAEAMESGDAAR